MKHLRTWIGCRRILIPLLVLALTALLAAGCGGKKAAAGGETGNASQETAAAGTSADRESGGTGQGTETGGGDVGEEDAEEEDEPGAAAADRNPDGTDADEEAGLPDRDGIYTSAEDVALYLHTYGTLPHNFMTKKDARKLGWEGGSLDRFAPDMCIGGDRFGNYEGVLPEGNYHECDINTLGKSKRGAERLVFDDQGNIYYTDDHYETFTLLYGGE